MTITTVAELIAALSKLDPSGRVLSTEPDQPGVQIVPQTGGGILIAPPPRPGN